MSPVEIARDYALNTNCCIFLTGKAGTGKTTFLRHLRESCRKQIMVVAPTGVAAINAEGVTIHSLFQLPPQLFQPTPEARRLLFAEMQMRASKRQLLRSLEMLIIDEISMVRADLLDAIDAVLRHVRHQQSLPFGGVQVVFIGDLYQLSPVAREQEWQLLRPYYQGPYFFQALVFREIKPIYIELDHVYRQNDRQFIDLLNQVRTNSLTSSALELLNSRYFPQWQQSKDEPYHIVLSTHNHKVDAINQRELECLASPAYTYHAEVEGSFPESLYPIDETLVLKKGARVMFIKNDSSADKLFYNGRLGIVRELDDEQVTVECETTDGDTEYILVHTERWENIRYVTSPDSETIQTEVAGTFSHIPLRLAWAVTIHKAQGLTFDHVVIDAEDAFASGQVYVALSRCRTLEGVVLLSRIPSHALTNAHDVLYFSSVQPSLTETVEGYSQATTLYFLQLLSGLYDFHDAIQLLLRLQRLVNESSSFNTAQADAFVKQLLATTEALELTADTFRRQLQRICLQPALDMAYLTERLMAASNYFSPRLQELIAQLQQSPVYTDDKTDAKDYVQLMEELYVHLSLKQHLQHSMATNPSIDSFFLYRERFIAPKVRFSAKGTDTKKDNDYTDHPQLLAELKKLRLEIAHKNHWDSAPYRVASTKTLVAISQQLPCTKKELLQIRGFGLVRFALFGNQVLDLIDRYRNSL